MTDEIARAHSRLPVDDSRDHRVVRIARMTYAQDKTLTGIASETGLNRWQVSRLLQEAKDPVVVLIEIVPRSQRHSWLDARLAETFGLRDAVVVPGPAEQGIEGVVQAAGQYLATLKPKPGVIGIAAGTDKHDVTLGTLKAGLINVLVTDEATATYVLEHAHDR